MLEAFETEAARLASARHRRVRASIEAAALSTANSAQQCVNTWASLQQLAAIVLDFQGEEMTLDLRSAAEALGPVIAQWRALDSSSATADELERLRTAVIEANSTLKSILDRASGRVADAIVAQQQRVSAARFLAAHLAVQDVELDTIWAQVDQHLNRLSSALAKRPQAEPPVGWGELQRRLEERASIRVCLKLAHLPENLDGLVGQLLREESVVLSDVPRDAVLSLMNAPALSALCQISLSH
jgi:hypothetical protein